MKHYNTDESTWIQPRGAQRYIFARKRTAKFMRRILLDLLKFQEKQPDSVKNSWVQNDSRGEVSISIFPVSEKIQNNTFCFYDFQEDEDLNQTIDRMLGYLRRLDNERN